MSGEIIYSTVDEFISGVRETGINKLAFAETKERRAEYIEKNPDNESDEKAMLDVLVVKRVELLGYKDGTIYKCIINGEDPDDLFNRLTETGFELKRRSRNII